MLIYAFVRPPGEMKLEFVRKCWSVIEGFSTSSQVCLKCKFEMAKNNHKAVPWGEELGWKERLWESKWMLNIPIEFPTFGKWKIKHQCETNINIYIYIYLYMCGPSGINTPSNLLKSWSFQNQFDPIRSNHSKPCSSILINLDKAAADRRWNFTELQRTPWRYMGRLIMCG